MFAPLREVLAVGHLVDLGARRIGTTVEQLSLRALEAALGSAFAARAVEAALRSRLVDALAVDVARYRVLQRVVDPLVEGEAIEQVLAAAEAAEVPQRVADQLLRDGIADAVAERIASGPELERIATAAIDTPAARRLVAHVIESGVVDEAVTRLLESEELWILVDEVARSPSVTDAISHQGAGLADQVGAVVRDRSRSADARLENVARRMLRRHARTSSNGAGPGPAE